MKTRQSSQQKVNHFSSSLLKYGKTAHTNKMHKQSNSVSVCSALTLQEVTWFDSRIICCLVTRLQISLMSVPPCGWMDGWRQYTYHHMSVPPCGWMDEDNTHIITRVYLRGQEHTHPPRLFNIRFFLWRRLMWFTEVTLWTCVYS